MAEIKKQVVIVGGGASGMIAAIAAKRQGADVTILERNPRIGKKILATGNGRCNFTNIYCDIDYYHGNNPKFIYSPLSQFSPYDAIDFFEELGISHKIEELGKVFPMSDQASSVLDVLRYELEQRQVNVICNAYVTEIWGKERSFFLKLEDGSIIQGDRVILATGGKAMPSSGSDGNGFNLAKKMGHSLTDVFPGLVQIMLEESFFKQIQGVKFVGTAEILYSDQSIVQDRGDILFANYGVSGPPILQLSRKVGELLNEGKKLELKITIIDTMSRDEVKKFMDDRFETTKEKAVDFSLVGLINKRLIPVLLKEAQIENIKRPVRSLSLDERSRIADILMDWRFEIKGTRGWSNAQVTAGGVNTDDIDPKTMESKIIKGLYLTGEVMDIDGQCGGFNLQWAWSSGFIAGKNAGF
ncbi:MAG TPA: NAD(P)/FAD-dependent oxidoreductase [Clostridia bacterium]|nr:NAD(P)/FAD-dependent oxidoreductase [Clostridia bacterium]